MKTYLLTGGMGFIGYHLAKRLLTENKRVVIMDSMKNYIPPEESLWGFYSAYRGKDLLNTGRELNVPLHIFQMDCNDQNKVIPLLDEYKPDVICHLAALSVAGICSERPSDARVSILDSALSMLEALKRTNLPLERFIYFSSSMVYGHFLRDQKGEIIPAEEDQKCDPIDVYGTLKLCGENLVKAYHLKHGLPYTIIRPSAVYGHTDCNRRVTEIFISNAMQGKDLLIDNKGTHQLDFTYADDLVEGVVRAAESSGTLNRTFNLSGGRGRTLNELAEIVCSLIPGAAIKRVNAAPFRPNRGAQNISRARETFGFSPSYDLETGMAKYIELFSSDFNKYQPKNEKE